MDWFRKREILYQRLELARRRGDKAAIAILESRLFGVLQRHVERA